MKTIPWIWQLLCILSVCVSLAGCGSDNSPSQGSSYSSRANSENGTRGLLLDEQGEILLRADAGGDSIADADTLVELNVAISSESNEALGNTNIAWTQIEGPQAVIRSPDSQRTLIEIPSLLSETKLTFQVQVSDDQGRTVTDTVSVIVSPLMGFVRLVSQLVEESDTDQIITLEVRLTEQQAQAVSIAYKTVDGTAVAGRDYIASEGIVTFPAGETRRTIEMTILSDFDIEETELFYVHFFDPVNAAIDYDQYPIAIAESTPTYTLFAEVSGLVGEILLSDTGGQTILVSGNGTIPLLTELINESKYNLSIESISANQICTLENANGSINPRTLAPVIIECNGVRVPVSGLVSGITGVSEPLVLRLNNQSPIEISENGNFQFENLLTQGQSYVISVDSPPGLECSVLNGTGDAGVDPITDIEVECKRISQLITVRADNISMPVDLELWVDEVLQDTMTVSREGLFTFANTEVLPAQFYEVVLALADNQDCELTDATGTVGEEALAEVGLSCKAIRYNINLDVSGLNGEIEITDTEGEIRTFSENGLFLLDALLSAAGYEYQLTSMPEYQSCRLDSGAGTIEARDVTLAVICEDRIYTVGGMAEGLQSAIQVQLNQEEPITLAADGEFRFDTELVHDDAYQVTVVASDDQQTCTLSNASGAIDAANISNVFILCETVPVTVNYDIGGNVSGLNVSETLGVELMVNGSRIGQATVAGSGEVFTYLFAQALTLGDTYSLSLTQPETQTCYFDDGALPSGALNELNVGNVVANITCEKNRYSVALELIGELEAVSFSLNEAAPISVNNGATVDFATDLLDDSFYEFVATSLTRTQQCTFENNSAFISGTDVTVVADCSNNRYYLSGTITGLGEGTVSLYRREALLQSFNGDGDFAITNGFLAGETVSLTAVGPDALECDVQPASVTIEDNNIGNLVIDCKPRTINIGFEAVGITGAIDVVLSSVEGEERKTLDRGDNTYFFNTEVPTGSLYGIRVESAVLICEITNPEGTAGTVDIANAIVDCSPRPFTVIADVLGLVGEETINVTLIRNPGEGSESQPVTVTPNGENQTILFPELTFISGDDYRLDFTSPSYQTCAQEPNTPLFEGDIVDQNIRLTLNCGEPTYHLLGAVSDRVGPEPVNLLLTRTRDGVTSEFPQQVGGEETDYQFSGLAPGDTYSLAIDGPSYQSCTTQQELGGNVGFNNIVIDIGCDMIPYRLSANVIGYAGVDPLAVNLTRTRDGVAEQQTIALSVDDPSDEFDQLVFEYGDQYQLSFNDPGFQNCVIGGNATGTGIIYNSDVAISILCGELTLYELTGTVSGHRGDEPVVVSVIRTRGNDTVTREVTLQAGAVNFDFNGPELGLDFVYGDRYDLSVQSPSYQSCTWSNKKNVISGAFVDADISEALTCEDRAFYISGDVEGYPLDQGFSVVLAYNVNSEVVTESRDNVIDNYRFDRPFVSGDQYTVAIRSLAGVVDCYFSNREQTITDVVGSQNVQQNITCQPTAFNVTANVSGLADGQQLGVTFVKNDQAQETASFIGNNENQSYTYPDSTLALDDDYLLTLNQPQQQTCSFVNEQAQLLGRITEQSFGNVVADIVCENNRYNLFIDVQMPIGDFTYQLSVNGNSEFSVNENGTNVSVIEFEPLDVANIQFKTESVLVCEMRRGEQVLDNNQLVFGAADEYIRISCVRAYPLSMNLTGELEQVLFSVNGGDSVTMNNNNESELLTNALVSGEPFRVTPTSLQPYETCEQQAYTGNMPDAAYTINARCYYIPYNVGGTLEGLDSITLDIVQEGIGSPTPVNVVADADGNFSLGQYIYTDSLSFAVQSPETHRCTISPTRVQDIDQEINNIEIQCSPYIDLRGNISGISGRVDSPENFALGYGQSPDQPDSELSPLAAMSDGDFNITGQYLEGNNYFVKVLTQPSNLDCSVENATGTVTPNTYVRVNCEPTTFSLGGSISGAEGEISLELSSRTLPEPVTEGFPSGGFTFSRELSDGADYRVSVVSSLPGLECAVANASGNITGEAIDNIDVTCRTLGRVNLAGPIAGATLHVNSEPTYTDDDNCSNTITTQAVDELEEAGWANIDPSCYSNAGWYLVTSRGGIDLDSNGDGVIEREGAYVGVFHALLSREQLQAGGWHVSPYTEAVYQRMRYLLSINGGSDATAAQRQERIQARLDALTRLLLNNDIDGDRDIDYDDLVKYDSMDRLYESFSIPEETLEMALAGVISSNQMDRLPAVNELFGSSSVGWSDYIRGRYSLDGVNSFTLLGNQVVIATTSRNNTEILNFSNTNNITRGRPISNTKFARGSDYIELIDLQSPEFGKPAFQVLQLRGADFLEAQQVIASTDFYFREERTDGDTRLYKNLIVSENAVYLHMAGRGDLVTGQPELGKWGEDFITRYTRSSVTVGLEHYDYIELASYDYGAIFEENGEVDVPHFTPAFTSFGAKHEFVWGVSSAGNIWILDFSGRRVSDSVLEDADLYDNNANNDHIQNVPRDEVSSTVAGVYDVASGLHVVYQAALNGRLNLYDVTDYINSSRGRIIRRSVIFDDFLKIITGNQDDEEINALAKAREVSNSDFSPFLVTVKQSGLYIYSVQNNGDPALRHAIDYPNKFTHIVADGKYIYAADENGITVFDSPSLTVPFENMGSNP